MAEEISKHKKYGFIYGKRIKTPLFRIAWPSLITAKESTFPVAEGEKKPDPRFEVTCLFEADDKEVKVFIKELEDMAESMLELYNENLKKGKLAEVGEVVKDGEEMDTEKYPYYEGTQYLIAKLKDRPELFDSKLQAIEPDVVRAGMKARAVIQPLLTARGLSYKLHIIQLAKDDGVRYAGGQTDSKSLLDSLDEDVEDDDVEVEEAPVKKTKNAKGTLALDKLG